MYRGNEREKGGSNIHTVYTMSRSQNHCFSCKKERSIGNIESIDFNYLSAPGSLCNRYAQRTCMMPLEIWYLPLEISFLDTGLRRSYVPKVPFFKVDRMYAR